ncbi:hypothetical protein LIER_25095 [Lithospermum erythrorhizon]|uniref:Reverse transcriptase/retrotransposon-derived protein RNase H-like domain-containing protein n=1 Tax=Lithospermum erythrorhizon TaxID=34254 RepID=A0AAV3R3I0_LITER
MKKDTPFQWDEKCFVAFRKVKEYLMNPLVLAAPIQGNPLILYVATQEQSVGALPVQENEEEAKALIPSTHGPLDIKSKSNQKAVNGHILADFLVDHPFPAEWDFCDDLPDEDVMTIEIRPQWKMYFDDMLYSFTLSQRDSHLIINELTGEYEVRKPEKINKQADALARLASSITYPGKEVSIPVCKKWMRPPIKNTKQKTKKRSWSPN